MCSTNRKEADDDTAMIPSLSGMVVLWGEEENDHDVDVDHDDPPPVGVGNAGGKPKEEEEARRRAAALEVMRTNIVGGGGSGRRKLYGRERECADLLAALRGLGTANDDGNGGGGASSSHRHPRPPKIVSLSGCSGAGKTSLAETLAEPAAESGRAFVRGKFDELRRTQPYSAFGSAFAELCEIILSKDDEKTVRAARDRINERIGESWRTIGHIVPNLREIMLLDDDEAEEDGGGVDDANISHENFHHLVQGFIEAASGMFPSVVLFLDDLQWADVPSIDLLRTLATSGAHDYPWLMIVLSYRSDEVKKDDPLLACLDGIKKREGVVDVTEIGVENLGRDSVNDMISDSLRMPHDETQTLADLIFAKSRGNCLHSIHFLKSLVEEGVLTFSSDIEETRRRWTWDEDAIEHLPLSDNMAELMSRRIRLLPPSVQDFLKTAACMGTQMDASTLDLLEMAGLLRCEDDHGMECGGEKGCQQQQDGCFGSIVTRLADRVIREGFMEKMGGCGDNVRYKFSHDRIALGAYSLIDIDEVDQWHHRIGECLLRTSSPEQLDKLIFVAADQMNRGSSLIEDDDPGARVELARLNYRAGKKSMSSSAIVPAVSYFRAGMDSLEHSGIDHWNDEYDLTLRLYQSYAECAYSVGLFDAMESTLNAIFANARTRHDKIEGYKTLVRSFAARNKLEKACATGLDILRDLGEPFPRKVTKMTILTELIKTKMALRGRSDDEMLSLPDMTDVDKIDAMELIGILFYYVYISRAEYIPLIGFRMIRLSLKHGWHDSSSLGFIIYSVLLCSVLADYREGNRYGRLALSFLDRSRTMRWHANVVTYYYCLSSHFAQPQRVGIEPLFDAYDVGMRAGCTDDSLLAAHVRCAVMMHCCVPLDQVDASFRSVNRMLVDHGQDTTRRVHVLMWQMVLNLRGGSASPLILTGEAMDQERTIKEGTENDRNEVTYLYFYRLMLASIFGTDDDLAVEMAERSRDIMTHAVGSFSACRHPLYQGLAAVAMARRSRETGGNGGRRERGKWTKLARYCKRRMKKFCSLTSCNFAHMHLLLKAECASLNNKSQSRRWCASLMNNKSSRRVSATSTALYDEAITAAKDNDYIGDAALANEKAGRFLLSHGDEPNATLYLRAAVKCYLEWGALGKVDQMKRHYEALLSEQQAA